jgi:hypothetical protein
MMLFLPVSGFQECLKIQSDLNKLSKWCDRNSLLRNVGKCKTITFSRSRYLVEFSYMMDGTALDRGSSINDLGVIMDKKMTFRSMWTSWLQRPSRIYRETFVGL